MVGKTKPPTASEKQRLRILKEHVPCIPCMLRLSQTRLPTIQHTTAGFKRDGHEHTYSACEYHHLGQFPDGIEKQTVIGMLGPSLAYEPGGYKFEFGPEALLVKIADKLVEAYLEHPWIDYDIPYDLRLRVREFYKQARR